MLPAISMVLSCPFALCAFFSEGEASVHLPGDGIANWSAVGIMVVVITGRSQPLLKLGYTLIEFFDLTGIVVGV